MKYDDDASKKLLGRNRVTLLPLLKGLIVNRYLHSYLTDLCSLERLPAIVKSTQRKSLKTEMETNKAC